MHIWYVYRFCKRFFMWLNIPIDHPAFDAKVRMAIGIVFFAVLPLAAMLLYEHSGLWNPVIGVEDGSEDHLITRGLPFFFYFCCWFANKAAATPRCMPKALGDVVKAFDVVNDKVASFGNRQTLQRAFEADLMNRTERYLEATKKASAEEIALSAMADVALEKNWMYEHGKAVDMLNELNLVPQSRIERLVVLR